mmetsp:Transcript_6412/g.9967  ORF Transcript_6412/g.9967 Transcript_6412/m.9967 type:complete len:113 (-) Transcript_6412:676-1014(-)
MAFSHTGSSYAGELTNSRIEGEGNYTFPSGMTYVGTFKDGMFHGKGTLYIPGLGHYEALWSDGIAIQGVYTFADGLTFKENDPTSKSEGWSYLEEKFLSIGAVMTQPTDDGN